MGGRRGGGGAGIVIKCYDIEIYPNDGPLPE